MEKIVCSQSCLNLTSGIILSNHGKVERLNTVLGPFSAMMEHAKHSRWYRKGTWSALTASQKF